MSKSELLPIEKSVRSAIQANFRDSKPKFVIGVSGGPDSMALLYLLHKFEADALVVHINYGKRGEESDKDAGLVEEMAFQWGFDCHSIKVNPDNAKDQNFQGWARNVRYDIFYALAAEHDADGIALAHHEDDQIETILQKLFRGAGLESWSAMKVWDGELFRPLLSSTKEEIEDYCGQKAIPFRVDTSNLESDFARNFLRNEWLENLEGHFPGWRKNVLNISSEAKLFSKALSYILEDLVDSKGCINRQKFLKLHPALARALLLHRLKGIDPGINVSKSALQQVEVIEDLQTGKSIQLTGRYSILRDRDTFKIVLEKEEELQIMTLNLEELKQKPFTFDGLQFEIGDYQNPDFETKLYLDAAKLVWPLTLRKWKSGDAFQPLGMEGHQNISDHLTNRKIGAHLKKKALILEIFEETIVAVIFPPIENQTPPGTIAESVKCDHTTGQCLIIK